ncbi:phospholipase [Shewanella sp. Choline-02u-19]|jgi:phospholipase A1|uniref:phospholipase A n=1 Tax=unclassified Shewanella TaxID=196818 RepID=UPI000C33EBD6|nr:MULTISPECIES: phospholipase A [unclassified Shewanella]PKG59079.1 phospholipase [Shewanella sp. GutDb-MelDb]PKG76035.1 phospholipase [Shewanella sp. GutCb]PKH56684.1 phospholipase [Shewanella sp. Bg11-22]PKI30235.1 phospholipase [Shewanella sp. Choline-02u-19]
MNKLGTLLLSMGLGCSFASFAATTKAEPTEVASKTEDIEVKKQTSLVAARVSKEIATADLPYVITPHKVNYILPVTYNSSPNMEPFAEEVKDTPFTMDNVEAKFQISFKFPLWHNVFGDNGHLFAAYTNQSYWQVYNKEISSPFRETNHEPEIFMIFTNDWQVGPLQNSFWGVGAVHQSNGQAGSLSRSWNRLYGMMIFDSGPFALEAKAWWRIPEDEKETPTSPSGDDNPDIMDYMGNLEFTGVYGLDEHRFSLMVRNYIQKPNYGAVEFTWSYPIMGNLRLYTQYFNGYGESLIDYNSHNQRIGIGISINDIL